MKKNLDETAKLTLQQRKKFLERWDQLVFLTRNPMTLSCTRYTGNTGTILQSITCQFNDGGSTVWYLVKSSLEIRPADMQKKIETLDAEKQSLVIDRKDLKVYRPSAELTEILSKLESKQSLALGEGEITFKNTVDFALVPFHRMNTIESSLNHSSYAHVDLSKYPFGEALRLSEDRIERQTKIIWNRATDHAPKNVLGGS